MMEKETRVVQHRGVGWVRWLTLPALLLVHFGIQAAARQLVVYRQFTDDAVLLQHGSWLHYMNHHTAQMLVALLLILFITRGRPGAAGLNVRNARKSARLLSRGFFPILLLFLLVGHTVMPLLQGVPPSRFAGDVRPLDIAGVMLFSWVLVGLSEEIVFRGFFQTMFARFWHGTIRVFDMEVPVAGLLAAVVFTLAHISFRTMTADLRQLVLAFVLGVYYAVAYHRTGSLLAPIVAHNLVDGGIVTMEWMVAELMT